MTKYTILGKQKALLLWSAVLSLLALLLIFPKDIRNGGTNGAFLCIQVLIPSLFPFMVLSDFTVRSGLSEKIPKAFGLIPKILFNLPEETFSVILLSLVGGYPVGAKGIKALYEKNLIDEEDAKRMSLFLIGAGPGFLLTFMGGVMLRDTKSGYILLTSQTLTIILTGIFLRFYPGRKSSSLKTPTTKKGKINGGSLVESVSSTVKSMANLCGLVVLFSAFCEVYLSVFGKNTNLRPLCAFLEITTGSKILAEGYSLPLISFFTAFSGFSVHLQIFSLLSPLKVSRVKFILARIFSAFLSMVITRLILGIFPRSEAVFSSIESPSVSHSGSVFGSVMLILLSALFILSLRKQNKSA